MNTLLKKLFCHATDELDVDWPSLVADQACTYLGRTCLKVRKSQPDVAIGSCVVAQSARNAAPVVVCPYRFLERGQIFLDCLHLLTIHEPGNELHRVPEIEIPGGNVDYFLVSVRSGEVVDFVGVELQAVDTTGSVWPARQQFLQEGELPTHDAASARHQFGINWKMTAKTTLVQLHHKVQTFEHLGKHLVLVLQDSLMNYMRGTFNFEHIHDARLGHSLHFHQYALEQQQQMYRLMLSGRYGTDARGIAQALDLQMDANVELDVITAQVQRKLSAKTRLTL